ncbi:ABC-three component system middle component 6 [Micromonospora inositola]|uniref:ABC-three component system middle component 6 n=1 Tax=Micromonospora inositola TaxID=47865 RepID=UPI000B5AE639|nr:ABC-three component system middle component 6 [Micromonospora inositola]
MITPTKGIAPQRSLLAVGAQVLTVLKDQPLSVNQAWNRLRQWRASNGHRSPVPFWWFVLSLDVLYSLGLVEFDGELLVRRRNARVA